MPRSKKEVFLLAHLVQPLALEHFHKNLTPMKLPFISFELSRIIPPALTGPALL